MSEEKKVKQTTVRFFEEDLVEIADLAKKMNVSQAGLVNEWRKSYERLKLEENSTQGENLKTLRAYTDKIVTLFTSMTEATEENVLSEQNKALEAEKRYGFQVIKTNEIKSGLDNQIKEQVKELKRLEKELDKYTAFEETVEGRMKDKDQIIQSKDANIISLTGELTDLRKENKSLQEFKQTEADLQSKIAGLKEELKEKDFEKQQALLDLREDLQAKHERRIQELLDTQSDKQDIIRNKTEDRMREEKRLEIARILENHSEEIARIRAESESTLEQIRQEHNKEVMKLQQEQNKEVTGLQQEHEKELKKETSKKNDDKKA